MLQQDDAVGLHVREGPGAVRHVGTERGAVGARPGGGSGVLCCGWYGFGGRGGSVYKVKRRGDASGTTAPHTSEWLRWRSPLRARCHRKKSGEKCQGHVHTSWRPSPAARLPPPPPWRAGKAWSPAEASSGGCRGTVDSLPAPHSPTTADARSQHQHTLHTRTPDRGDLRTRQSGRGEGAVRLGRLTAPTGAGGQVGGHRNGKAPLPARQSGKREGGKYSQPTRCLNSESRPWVKNPQKVTSSWHQLEQITGPSNPRVRLGNEHGERVLPHWQ